MTASRRACVGLLATATLLACPIDPAAAQDRRLPRIVVSKDGTGFVEEAGGARFAPRGFNYDHDDAGRLLEDYWEREWKTVEEDFAEMKALGANVVRIHLQVARFLQDAKTPNAAALERLGLLLKLAERTGMYLDLTGLGCYHKADVPAWYDALSETDRWDAQAVFWRAIADRCAGDPTVFCFDLMNEPVVPGGRRKAGDWLGPAFGGKHFVQFVVLDQNDRPRPEIAGRWIRHLAAAIRERDKRRLITVGLVDWSLDRPGLTSGFDPQQTSADVDFVSVHLYPKKGKIDEALETLAGFAVGKPVLIEETFPLGCTPEELETFLDRSRKHAAGWVGFYWGVPIEKLEESREIKDAITAGWLRTFRKLAAKKD